MKTTLHKKSIIQKTLQVGGSTFMSRVLGIIREYFLVKYLGAGAVSDAFFTAFKIPNSLRKIFAEGALSAAFIPTFVGIMHKDNKKSAHRLMTLSFLFFEGIVLVLCALAMWKAEAVLQTIAPGFSSEQIAYAVPYLRILMPFIFFISSSALLAGALQSVNHFFVPAFSPVLLNIVFVSALIICLTQKLPVEYLCFFILLGGFVQFLLHLFTYFRLNFSFDGIDAQTWQTFKGVLKKFVPCTIAMSVMEMSLFIDTSFASYLPPGSISLLRYANRFMGIPLGVFAVAFSTILLPHFSRVSTYAPKRLSFYLLESAKLILWITLPVALMMGFFGEKIFSTLFLSKKFTFTQVVEAHSILVAFLLGLFFFSLNKIILNVYYARHSTLAPTIISVVATIINIGFNVVLMKTWQATGLAMATSLSIGLIQTFLLLVFIRVMFGFRLYLLPFLSFGVRYCMQLTVVLAAMTGIYYVAEKIITLFPVGQTNFMLMSLGYWLWVGPLCILSMLILFYTKRFFGVRLYFLE